MTAPASTSQATRLLRIPEVADALGVSRRTVYRLISDGLLSTVDVGRDGFSRTRVHPDALAAYVHRHTTPARGRA